MALLQIAEVFGHNTALPRAERERDSKFCPFRESACTKGSTTNPLGTCSLGVGGMATVICPVRFREKGRMFIDAGREAFGAGKRVLIVPEYRLLNLPGKIGKKIGKVDYLIAEINAHGLPVDFAALEVQAVYISGKSVRPAFDHYVRTGELLPSGRRRPDFRSSAQKRLMPQLALKLPIFRRWGKRFFVAVDSAFFSELPSMKTTSRGNAEITWLSYPIEAIDTGV